MLINFSSLLNQKIISLDIKLPVAYVKDIIVDPKNGNFLAFLVKKNIFAKKQVITSTDIVGILKNAIVISDENRIIDPSEVIRISHIYPKKIRIFRNWAKTRSGKMLGRVDDVILSTNPLAITKYFINGSACNFCFMNLFRHRDDRLITQNDIYKITKNAIIVKDNVLKNPLKIINFAEKKEKAIIAAQQV